MSYFSTKFLVRCLILEVQRWQCGVLASFYLIIIIHDVIISINVPFSWARDWSGRETLSLLPSPAATPASLSAATRCGTPPNCFQHYPSRRHHHSWRPQHPPCYQNSPRCPATACHTVTTTLVVLSLPTIVPAPLPSPYDHASSSSPTPAHSVCCAGPASTPCTLVHLTLDRVAL